MLSKQISKVLCIAAKCGIQEVELGFSALGLRKEHKRKERETLDPVVCLTPKPGLVRKEY